jgi:hypothetical protein
MIREPVTTTCAISCSGGGASVEVCELAIAVVNPNITSTLTARQQQKPEFIDSFKNMHAP